MESLGSIALFVLVAETRSFTQAGKRLGISSSGVGKSIGRLEENLGARLFHRSTRSIALTLEGSLFLERCRRILAELEAAEMELSNARDLPRGRLRVSVPLVSGLVMPVIIEFMRAFPDIELDIDFSDRMVDIIEEGFDVVLRTGDLSDSRLLSKRMGGFQLRIVGAPDYFERRGMPAFPADLVQHACLHHKFPSSGKFELWPLRREDGADDLDLPQTMICNTTEILVDVARAGLGIACLPDFMIASAIKRGELVSILDDYTVHTGSFRLLWPSSKHLSVRLRVFIDFLHSHLFAPVAGNSAD
ncbi:LysR substrate-binding domain-containing protein [Pseudomonas cannabina]|uniref:Regulatory protein LysR, substrate-binding protein n=3 Tax=Pseudomonas syringae group TaxID=136849 RepID=A0A3M3RAD4_PSECA|nr:MULTISPECIES: LysR substrate-binding domain-containing protein [Pseudomonas syringae group]KPB71633.1 Regulatory protein [Pseudomonas syringae pv. maculicola]KPW21335.1 Regulatory protein, LysR:LysR, substrate-binding [Pseudomonas cannabina pv. alisalensis]MBM0138468.1 LysR family transcriptional regulator [Pseudomonas cannabina pv. alisalensis]QHE97542.1 LysR family transcriptional regulator [Pseudomonas syringae pv. maculicola str. ES4326]QQN24204.1 LysR family transcriptional regulator [